MKALPQFHALLQDRFKTLSEPEECIIVKPVYSEPFHQVGAHAYAVSPYDHFFSVSQRIRWW